MVYPDASVCASEGVGGEEVWFVVWIGVFEEFAEDEGFVERFAFVFESGDEASRVYVCRTRA